MPPRPNVELVEWIGGNKSDKSAYGIRLSTIPILIERVKRMAMSLYRLIPNKREFLARGLRGFGLLSLLERFARRPCLLVFTHHRIGSQASNPFYDPVCSASLEAFREQVVYLRDHFRLIKLDELLALAEKGFAFTEPTAMIAFDDGYRDNAVLAWPILQELGVPATFFLPTGFLDNPRLPWWDHIAYVVKQTRQAILDLEIPSPLSINLQQTARPAAIWSVIRTFMNDQRVDEAEFLIHLGARANVTVDSEALGRDLFMTWDQVRELDQAGMAIGSHSHNHYNLARLSEADQLHELTESKQILERRLGREITCLAYPFGERGDFTDRTKHLARTAGYRLAFSGRNGTNRPGAVDPFDIARVSVGYRDTSTMVRARAVLYAAFGSSRL
jgi:peptidoglycan/xylan/chitin deacetylase (PgdA/CDA1 family)